MRRSWLCCCHPAGSWPPLALLAGFDIDSELLANTSPGIACTGWLHDKFDGDDVHDCSYYVRTGKRASSARTCSGVSRRVLAPRNMRNSLAVSSSSSVA